MKYRVVYRARDKAYFPYVLQYKLWLLWTDWTAFTSEALALEFLEDNLAKDVEVCRAA